MGIRLVSEKNWKVIIYILCKKSRLVTGDCDGTIYLWEPTEDSWSVDSEAFHGHSGSVEDLKFSPVEANVILLFLLT